MFCLLLITYGTWTHIRFDYFYCLWLFNSTDISLFYHNVLPSTCLSLSVNQPHICRINISYDTGCIQQPFFYVNLNIVVFTSVFFILLLRCDGKRKWLRLALGSINIPLNILSNLYVIIWNLAHFLCCSQIHCETLSINQIQCVRCDWNMYVVVFDFLFGRMRIKWMNQKKKKKKRKRRKWENETMTVLRKYNVFSMVYYGMCVSISKNSNGKSNERKAAKKRERERSKQSIR